VCAQIINKVDPNYSALTAIHHHFSRIAPKYRDFRTTDPEPITFIAKELDKLVSIEAVDIGCGAGRYDLLLCRYLGNKLRLTCADANSNMLETLDEYLIRHGISNFTSMHSEAENLPFPSNALDCVCTFNAIHHFNLPDFLQESARILKSGGYLFIYTRLREQNKRNIWGRYFPKFHHKETRLYTLNALTQAVAAVPTLGIKSIEFFKYQRTSTSAKLIEHVEANHYSTFALYSPGEMKKATTRFVQRIANTSNGGYWIHWFDENILFVIRKEG
jgi:ubiquinone/menaquinone biosynthesis C-methylase UbiE